MPFVACQTSRCSVCQRGLHTELRLAEVRDPAAGSVPQEVAKCLLCPSLRPEQPCGWCVSLGDVAYSQAWPGRLLHKGGCYGRYGQSSISTTTAHMRHLFALRLDHICLDQSLLMSPLHASCYGDDDMATRLSHSALHCSKVGKAKGLAVRSTPRRLGRQVLFRWAAYVCVRWLRRLGD